MQIVFNGNMSYADAAEKFTIGGAAYGVALANLAGDKGEFEYPAKGTILNVPDSWIKPSWLSAVYQPTQQRTVDINGGGQMPVTVTEQKSFANWLLYGAIGVLGMMLLTGKKRTNRRNR